MVITDTMPVSVNALSIAAPEVTEALPRHNDPGSVILCRMDNGAVFRLFGLWLPGHSNWYRVHGTHGAMEITRGPGYFGPEQVRVWHEDWTLRPGETAERVYVLRTGPSTATWPNRAGHGGGDFWTNFLFANAIRSGEAPFLDVYRGVAMSSVGILAWKSALADGAPFAVPDFRCEVIPRGLRERHLVALAPGCRARSAAAVDPGEIIRSLGVFVAHCATKTAINIIKKRMRPYEQTA